MSDIDGQIMFADVAEMDARARDDEYQQFVEKFKPKKTTDDCYTPPGVMAAVEKWVVQEFSRDPAKFIRPFWPGADYRTAEYPDGCTVVDNPPFSILSQIEAFYIERDIPFFLFAPTLTCMEGLRRYGNALTICLAGAAVIYENGAKVNTSFVTNLDSENVARTCPELRESVQKAADEYKYTRTLPKYEYPYSVFYAADYLLAKYGQDYRIKRGEAEFIRSLDSQGDKTIFGGGLLVSERAAAERAAAERAAAERAAAERAAAERWELSDRELAIIARLSNKPHDTPVT